MYNTDAKRRAQIVFGKDVFDYMNNVQVEAFIRKDHFDIFVDRDVAQKLVDEAFLDINDSQPHSPSVKQTFELFNRLKSIVK